MKLKQNIYYFWDVKKWVTELSAGVVHIRMQTT